MVDFTIPENLVAARERVRRFVADVVMPAEAEVGSRPYDEIVVDLQALAYKIEQEKDFRQENSIAKIYIADKVGEIVDRSIQICGSLGYSNRLPLESWFRHARAQRIVDGPNEVHKWMVARNVIRAFKDTGTTRSACGDFI